MREKTTCPFRFRDEMNAQDLLDCDMSDCVSIENFVRDALGRFER